MRHKYCRTLKFAFMTVLLSTSALLAAAESTQVSNDALSIRAGHFEIRLQANAGGRLTQLNFGAAGAETPPPATRPKGKKISSEALYPEGGAGTIWEPALLATH